MTSSAYSTSPDWLSELFTDLHGDDMKDGGQSIIHLISAAFYFATCLDLIEKGNAHVGEIYNIVKNNFDRQHLSEVEIDVVKEQIQKNFSTVNEFVPDDNAISKMIIYISLLKEEIIKTGKMMSDD